MFSHQELVQCTWKYESSTTPKYESPKRLRTYNENTQYIILEFFLWYFKPVDRYETVNFIVCFFSIQPQVFDYHMYDNRTASC